jgi:DeoR family lactose phosphotransferase system repressor
MLKEQRYEFILENLNKFGTIKVADLTQKLKATEMTIRRDLKYLEEQNLLIRIHGGARSKQSNRVEELSPNEKRGINADKKIETAKIAASLIKENDIVYLGPGTTTEYMCDYINASSIKVITNCLNIFEKLRYDDRIELILIGGRLRNKTNTFVGSFANHLLEGIRVKLAFIGANGVLENHIMTSNEEEGKCQQIIMNNALKRYLVCDSSKIEREDFYTLYKLEDLTALVTDSSLDEDLKEKYSKYCKIINSIKEE